MKNIIRKDAIAAVEAIITKHIRFHLMAVSDEIRRRGYGMYCI